MALDARARTAFLLLVLAQAAHSVEEYVFRLWEVFFPARLVSSLFSSDLETGFIMANTALVAFGAWCYIARVGPAHPSARLWVWPWVVVETINGIGHPTVALVRREYFPGMITAPVLLAVALYLGARLADTEHT